MNIEHPTSNVEGGVARSVQVHAQRVAIVLSKYKKKEYHIQRECIEIL